MDDAMALQCQYVAWSQIDWQQRAMELAMTEHNHNVKINLPVFFFIYSAQALALYISAELIAQTLLRFRSWSSLYFWSLILSSCGVITLAVIDIVINILKPFGSDAMNSLEFVATCLITTGFSMVLYSRLHTIAQGKRFTILRFLLAAIIVVAVGSRIPQVVLITIINNANRTTPFLTTLSNKIWYTDCAYTILDLFLSLTYIWWFYSYLDDLPSNLRSTFEAQRRKMMAWLVTCFTVDLALVVLQFVIIARQYRLLLTIYWTTAYAIKLKLEFAVLNRLSKVTEAKRKVLAEGNWAHGLEAAATKSSADDPKGSRAPTMSSMESSTVPQASRGKDHINVSVTDELERVYLGRFKDER